MIFIAVENLQLFHPRRAVKRNSRAETGPFCASKRKHPFSFFVRGAEHVSRLFDAVIGWTMSQPEERAIVFLLSLSNLSLIIN